MTKHYADLSRTKRFVCSVRWPKACRPAREPWGTGLKQMQMRGGRHGAVEQAKVCVPPSLVSAVSQRLEAASGQYA